MNVTGVQSRILGAGQVSWNKGPSINTSCMTYKRRALQAKNFVFFLHDILKAAFQMKIYPIDAYKQGNFFSKIRVPFIYFQKRQGKSPTLALSSFAPKLIYFLKRG